MTMEFDEMKHVRREYKHGELLEHNLDPDPLKQFDVWFREALNADIDMADAMTLATVSAFSIPSARIVALRSYNERGFVFYTNYKSNKAVDIKTNPQVALVFYWKELDRQVIIMGTAKKISKLDSDNYFASRPAQSNIVQAISRQSQIVASKAVIKRRINKAREQYENGRLIRPAHWGGYCVTPTQVEFWEGGLGRLHDRIRYEYNENSWSICRLEP